MASSREPLSYSHQPRYPRQQVEGLVNGFYVESGVHFSQDSWAWMRSRVERYGEVESEEWVEVLDLERALRLLASPAIQDRRDLRTMRDAQMAAVLISARLMLGFDRYEMRAFAGRGRDAEKLVRKGCAWLSAYLSGRSIDEAEKAFRKAR